MKTLGSLIKRNVKMFFKDKGLFFTSLITPMILLVLYATFLTGVYRDAFVQTLPPTISSDIIEGLIGGEVLSSMLAVSCVTVAFCSNMLMVQDKVTGSLQDLSVSPLKKSTLALSYYLSTFISTMIVCLAAFAVCLVYVAITGWYYTVGDVLLCLADVVLLVAFGTALSSLINFFLSSQGQISAVGSMVSSTYGFLCGAYMPISQFPVWMQKVIAFFPGTHGTVLLRRHALSGAIRQLSADGVPDAVIELLKDSVDGNLYFFDMLVPEWTMYLVLIGFTVLTIAAYVLLHYWKHKKK
jgi:multidrug/hemolysin transport system permease protein